MQRLDQNEMGGNRALPAVLQGGVREGELFPVWHVTNVMDYAPEADCEPQPPALNVVDTQRPWEFAAPDV